MASSQRSVLTGISRREMREILQTLDRIPEAELPNRLKLIKGMNCEALGLDEDANRLFLDLCEDDLETVSFRETFNAFRVSRHATFAGDGRPKVLTNGKGGRIGLSLFAVADVVCFCPGDSLSRVDETTIQYRLGQDTIQDIFRMLPEGWVPDFICFLLCEVFSLPLGLEEAPRPVVGIAGDPWKFNKLFMDFLFFDAAVPAIAPLCAPLERMERTRILHAPCAGVQGHVPWMIDDPESSQGEAEYDIIFTGTVASPFYRTRSRYLWRLMGLMDRYRIFVGYFDTVTECHEAMRRAKIVVHCPSIQGGVNLRPFEAIACGSLLLHEEADRSITEFFEPGKEIVLFNEENFEPLLEYYLAHDDERTSMTARAAARNDDAAIRINMRKTVEAVLEARLPVGPRGAASLSEAEKWNAQGVSDYHAPNAERAILCFRNALAADSRSGVYAGNMGVALMTSAYGRNVPPSADIEPLLMYACAGRSGVAVFNMVCYRFYLEKDSANFLAWSSRLIREIRNGSDFSDFNGDEIYFKLDAPVTHFGDGFIFELEMERLLMEYPQRGPHYQQKFLRALLWRTLELTGRYNVRTGQDAGAVGAFESALRECPENETILAELGRLYLKLGAPEKAMECFERILEFSPLFEEAHIGLASVEIVLGETGGTAARLDRLLRYGVLSRREEIESLRRRVSEDREEAPAHA